MSPINIAAPEIAWLLSMNTVANRLASANSELALILDKGHLLATGGFSPSITQASAWLASHPLGGIQMLTFCSFAAGKMFSISSAAEISNSCTLRQGALYPMVVAVWKITPRFRASELQFTTTPPSTVPYGKSEQLNVIWT